MPSSPEQTDSLLEDGACCVCGGREGEKVVEKLDVAIGSTKSSFAFIKCPSCGVLYLDPKPKAESLGLLYPDGDYYTRDFDALANAISHQPSGLKRRLQERIMGAYEFKVQSSRFKAGGSSKFKVQSSKSERVQSSEFKVQSPESECRDAEGFWGRLVDGVGRLSVYPILVRRSALLKMLIHHRRFFRFERRPARILEVGFGVGFLLHALSHLDTELYGTEISEKACDAVSDLLGVDTFCGHFWDAGYQDGHFDLVIFSHSLEHLSDPMRALNEARRIISPTGGLLISVPNPDCLSARLFREYWTGYDFPRHLFLFGHEAMSKIAQKTGFELAATQYPVDFSVHHFTESAKARFGRSIIPGWLSRSLPFELLYLPIKLAGKADVMTMYFRPSSQPMPK
ncbi:MAG: class I SAM-dependent methyltransferase [Candidatus Coatesbacteria bacterium]|nr:class I SAM-dependent methyltransferase [Candidatus Coatesbacteria bacterium]